MKLAFACLAAGLALATPSYIWQSYGMAEASLAAMISASASAAFVAVQMHGLK